MASNTCPECGLDRGDSGNAAKSANSGDVCPHCGAKAEKGKKGASRLKPWHFLAIVGIIIVLAVILVPNHMRATSMNNYLVCVSNERDIAAALEMYAYEHESKYPAKLQELVPTYIPAIPACKTGKKDTYSATYTCSKAQDNYTFFCQGAGHPEVGRLDYPQYNSREGLLKKK